MLDAAIEVFARKGYVETSVQDIADAVGLLKGSLYHYIDSKEGLLYRLLNEVHDDVEAILAEVADFPGLGPLERLERYVERQVAYNLANLDRISVYYHDVHHLGDQRRQVILGRRRVHERFVARLVAEAQVAGEADPTLDPVIATNCVFATIIWVYRWYRPGRFDAEALARDCARYAIEALRAPA